MAEQNEKEKSDVGVRPIRLDEIDKGPAHIRTHINEEALDELKDSIGKLGLLQPIVVTQKKKGKYPLVIGSRRVLACEKLGWDKIHAVVLDKQNKERLLAASLAENMFRSKLSKKDTAKAVTKLYKLYDKDVKKVAKTTGMWPETILRYVYLEEYGSKQMLEWVNEGDATLLDVKRMLQIAKWNIGKAERMLETMIKEGMTPTQRKNFAEYMKTNPSAKMKEGAKDAKKTRIRNKILVDLTPEIRDAIQKAMKDWKMEADEVALQALQEWLEDQGYIE